MREVTHSPAASRARALFATPRARALALLALVLAASGLFSALSMPLTASAATGVEVAHIAQAVPRDPQSEMWEQGKESNIAMSGQQIFQPGGGSVLTVRVRALEDGRDIAFRVSWDDPSKNDTQGAVPTDAAAIQLPMDPAHLPYACMGQSSSRVNIWQWKAALEREAIDNETVAMDTGALRNLTSNGICKAIEAPGSQPSATSYHDGKAWHVVFHRHLGGAQEGTAPLTTDKSSSIAFAVWNGERNEMRGMKAVTSWNALTFQTPEQSNIGNLVTLGAVILVSIGVVAWAMRRLAS